MNTLIVPDPDGGYQQLIAVWVRPLVSLHLLDFSAMSIPDLAGEFGGNCLAWCLPQK